VQTGGVSIQRPSREATANVKLTGAADDFDGVAERDAEDVTTLTSDFEQR
jgi:hypothetical protein